MSTINNPPPSSVNINIDINDVMPPPTVGNKGDIVTIKNPETQDTDDVQDANKPDDANTSTSTTINITLTAGSSTENINIQIYQTATPSTPVPPPDPSMVAATHDYIQGTGAQYIGGSGGSDDSNVNNQGQGSGQGGETGGASGAGSAGGIMGYSGIMGGGGAGGGGGGGGEGDGSGTGGGSGAQGTTGASGSSNITGATGSEGPQGLIGMKASNAQDEQIRNKLATAINNWFASNPQTAFNMTYGDVIRALMSNEAVMNVVAEIATRTTEKLADEEMAQARALGKENQAKDMWQVKAAAIGMAVTGFCCIMSTRAMGKERPVPEESGGEFTAVKTGNPGKDTLAMKEQNAANDQMRAHDNETSNMQKGVRDREQTIASKQRQNAKLDAESEPVPGESPADFKVRSEKNSAKKAENNKDIEDMKAQNANEEKTINKRVTQERQAKIADLKAEAKAKGADLEDTKTFQVRKSAVIKKNAEWSKANMQWQTLSQMGGNISQMISGLGAAEQDAKIGETQAQQARLQGASKVNDTLANLASQGIQADESMIQAFLQGRATLSQTMAQYMGALYKFS